MTTLKNLMLGALLISGLSFANAQAASAVDTSIDGIFNALTTSKNLQKTVDKLIANGANYQSIVTVAGASGISEKKIAKLQFCNNAQARVNALGVTCLKPSTVAVAYATGVNDPLQYLPATAAGKKQ